MLTDELLNQLVSDLHWSRSLQSLQELQILQALREGWRKVRGL
jgi:hypothetical protein